MLISSFAGSAILSTQNQTERLLVLNKDVVAGQPVSRTDFVEQEVLVSSLNTQWLKPHELSAASYYVTSLKTEDTLRASDVGQISSNQRLVHLSLDIQELPLDLKVADQVEVWSANPQAQLIGTFTVANLERTENQGSAQVSLISPASAVKSLLSAMSGGEFQLVTVV
jgi:hypothetical protein